MFSLLSQCLKSTANGMNYSKLAHDILAWRIKHVSNKNFILLLSFVIGITGGLAAVFLKTFVHFIHHSIHSLPASFFPYIYLILPLVGVLLTVGYKVIVMKGKLGHGIPNLLYTISKKSGLVERDKTYSHLVSGSMTVSLGGSVGLEAPIVTTGAAFGSNIGRTFHLGYKHRTLLIGCGGSAAIAAIFNSPIAGVIFSLEVLLLELSVPAFIPLLIAAATGTLLSQIILGNEILFSFSLTDPFSFSDTPQYLLLGILTGLVSLYFTRITYKAEEWVRRIKHIYSRALIGGLALSLMVFIFPPLYGEGYEAIEHLLHDNPQNLLAHNALIGGLATNEWLMLGFIGALILVKAFASAFTISAGGNGGIFAPSLFIGAISGFFLARLLNETGILPIDISEKNFVLVGMAGVMSGVLHAPLTAIFLIAEITNGYMLFLPLMIVSAIAYATISYFEPHSLYTKQLALKGHLHPHDKDKFVLTRLNLEQMLEDDFTSIKEKGTLRDVVNAVSSSQRNTFPVVDEENHFKGLIKLDDIREIMFKPEYYDQLTIDDIKQNPATYIHYEDTMEEVMRKFDESGDWRLPVIDNEHYVGFLSKSKIFSYYRSSLKKEAREDSEIMQ